MKHSLLRCRDHGCDFGKTEKRKDREEKERQRERGREEKERQRERDREEKERQRETEKRKTEKRNRSAVITKEAHDLW